MKNFKKVLLSVLAISTALIWFWVNQSSAFTAFEDYSSWNTEVVAQFTDFGGEVIHVGWSMTLTTWNIFLDFLAANAIGIIIILLVVWLIAYLNYRKRMKSMSKTVA